jgi:hypothetical protein
VPVWTSPGSTVYGAASPRCSTPSVRPNTSAWR